MNVFSSVSLLCLLLHSVVAVYNDLSWNHLSAHFAPPDQRATDRYAFGSFPVTMEEAENDGFVHISDSCQSGNFLGHRFMKSGDPAVILLFDNAGYIAGVQSSVPIKWIESNGKMKWFTENQMFVKDVVEGMDSYTLTAYFIDPKRICGDGRSVDEFRHAKIGTGLYFQNGTDPIRDSTTEYPRAQRDVDWLAGPCVPSMGFHYWLGTTLDMDCTKMWPLFTIFSRGHLIGFGWSIQELDLRGIQSGFEIVPGFMLNNTMKPVPKCLVEIYDKGQILTSLHFYFVKDPAKIECPDQTK